VELGFDAVPVLMDHLDDHRLTRSIGQRVRDVAAALLLGLAGSEADPTWGILSSKDSVLAWWVEAQKRGEKAQVRAEVFPKGAKYPPSNQLLRILVKKYPQDLPELYRTLLLEHPQKDTPSVARALVRSRLPREKKVELLTEGSTCRHLRHRYHALSELRELDEDRFHQRLIETLDGLPRSAERYYWSCPESRFALLVAHTGNVRAWQVLEKTAKRSDVGLRLEMLRQVCEVEPRRYCKEHLAFLAAFLEDATVRDMKADLKRFDGDCAGMDFPSLEVRNYTAMQIARLLKLDRKPQPSWDAEQWARFRDEVREALKR
jgi:hypothetical protein